MTVHIEVGVVTIVATMKTQESGAPIQLMDKDADQCEFCPDASYFASKYEDCNLYLNRFFIWRQMKTIISIFLAIV